MRERAIPALVTLFTISGARASDIATTFHFNPSLSREANPLVTVFGANATQLVLSNVIVLALALLVPLYLYWRFPAARLKDSTPDNPRDFMCQQIYGRRLENREFYSAMLLAKPLPKNWLQALRAWGFAGTWMIAIASFHAAFSWWALHAWHWESYRQLRRTISIQGYSLVEMIPALVCGVFILARYSRMEFAAYQRSQPAA